MSDPILIDTARFTQEAQSISSQTALSQLDERVSTHELLASADDLIHYRASGGIDRWQRPFLDLHIKGSVKLVCQRCLKPVRLTIDDSAHMVLFDNEDRLDEAMAADETLEGLLYTAETNLTLLLEDQILMAMPFAPRHEDCDNATLDRVNQDQVHPFAQLAGLKNSH